MTVIRRLGWGMAVLLLVAAVAFVSMVRITFGPAAPAHQAAAPAPAAPARGTDAVPLIIPVQGVGPSQLTDTWGQSRGGGSREHHAIDIMAPQGTPVLAAASGTVEKIFESAAGGHTVYVRTRDGGTVHYYAHLDSYGVREGQAVQQGQPIARVGNTGSAAGGPAHLHFEIKTMAPGERWWQGTNVNPYPLLARIGGGG
jgi:peptidoglycan LD-endopeptidase LytH